jgi:plastocyanin
MSKLTRSVQCGSRLQFNWNSGFHDVYLATGTGCTTTGGTTLAALGSSGSYTWTARSNGQFNLICSYSSHCQFGNMQVLVTVSGC